MPVPVDPATLKSLASILKLPATKPILRLLSKAFAPLLLLAPQKLLGEFSQKRGLLEGAGKNIPDSITADTQLAKEEKLMLLELLREQGQATGIHSPEFLDSYAWYRDQAEKVSVFSQTLQILKTSDPNANESAEDSEISDHWFDNFERFLREFRNEEWRATLLSNCLALESKQPGSVFNRSVWSIAMLDESDFWDLQDFVRYACRIRCGDRDRGFFIVGYYVQLTRSDYTRTNGEIDSFDELFKRLESIGMTAIGNGTFDLWSGKKHRFEMGPTAFHIQINEGVKAQVEEKFMRENKVSEFREVEDGNERFSINSIGLSPLGNNIAQLCTRVEDHQALGRLELALREQTEKHDITVERTGP